MRYWCSTLPLPLILFCGPGCFNSEAGIQPSNGPVGKAELTHTSGQGDKSAADDECRSGDGMPFRLAPGVKVASYGLNSNDDGIQNYGELAVDCGGGRCLLLRRVGPPGCGRNRSRGELLQRV
jgi:hypothetical protein